MQKQYLNSKLLNQDSVVVSDIDTKNIEIKNNNKKIIRSVKKGEVNTLYKDFDEMHSEKSKIENRRKL